MGKKIHGHYGTKAYRAWEAAIQRCENSKAFGFRWYGVRGIKVCPRWRNSFAAFFEDMGERLPDATLDRDK